jgi:hypothetical protein
MKIGIRVNAFGVAEVIDKPRGVAVSIRNELRPTCNFEYAAHELLAGGAWPADYEAQFLRALDQTHPAIVLDTPAAGRHGRVAAIMARSISDPQSVARTAVDDGAAELRQG